MAALIFFVFLNFILLLFAFVFLFYRQTDKKRSDLILKEIRYQVNNLIGELDVVTDREVTLLEDRLAEAKAVIKKLEKRIAQLQALVQNNEVLESLYDSIEENEIEKKRSKTLKKEKNNKKADLQMLSSLSQNEIIKKSRAAGTPSQKGDYSGENRDLAAEANASLSIREQVLLLRSKGVENKKIANQLKIAFDEVETILAMNFFSKKK